MKKLERLLWIERTFGPEFVLPYRACRTWEEIEFAFSRFESAGRTWGIRTDFVNGRCQGHGLPFLHHGSAAGAKEIWSLHGEKLVYIVSENVLRRRLSGVGIKVGSEHVLFEWNDKEPTISQREMYDKPENVQRIVVGPGGYELVFGEIPIRCVPPEYTSWRRFDEIYDVMIHMDVDEATFTVREDGKLVVW